MTAPVSIAALAARVAKEGLTRELLNVIAGAEPEGDTQSLLVLGQALLAANQLTLAEKFSRHAYTQSPGDVVTQVTLGEVLRLLGHAGEARALYDAAAGGGAPTHIREMARMRSAGTFPVIAMSHEEIAGDRARLAKALAVPPPETVADAHAHGGFTNFYLAYHAQNDLALQRAAAAYYLALCPSLAARAPHVDMPVPGGRVRVGIVSRHLFDHTIGYLNHGLITGLDRDAFEVTLFRIPSGRENDDVARTLAGAVEHVADLPNDLLQAREIIARARMDVLHYPDVGMEYLGYFLAFARLARVQTVGWGHPVTTGIPNIDHFLSIDAMEPQDAAAHYSENLARLKARVPAVPAPRHAPAASGKAAFGMDAQRPAYLCAQALFKVHPDFDEVVARLLARDPDGIVYFVSLWDHANTEFLARLSKAVGGNMTRVRILPRVTPPAFPSLVAAADVLLDVPQWAGGRTSLEGFAAGMPIVHWPGKFMRGRHTLAFYKHMEIGECVVDNAGQYAETAWRLAHDQAFRDNVRNTIRERSPRLFNDMSAVRETEAVWKKAMA